MLLPNGFLDWVIFSTSTLLRTFPVVVLLPWVKSHNTAGVFGFFLTFLILGFHTASAQPHRKFKFLIFCAAANGGIHSLHLVFSLYFLSSFEYRGEKWTRRKALAAYLLLALSCG